MRAFFLITLIAIWSSNGLLAQETEPTVAEETTVPVETETVITTETTTSRTNTEEAVLPENPPADSVEYEEPLPLIPENPNAMEDPVAYEDGSEPAPMPAVEPSEDAALTIQELQDLKDRIRFREVKTRALKDPAVVAEWDASKDARTDPAKRNALRRYYKALYSRMSKIDSSLEKLITTEEKLSLKVLDQPRVHAEDRVEGENDFNLEDPAEIKVEETKTRRTGVL